MTTQEPIWLPRDMVDQIHTHLIQRFGGSYGIRDAALIDGALARPRQKWAYDPECDMATCAAAYAFGLAKNHGYVDGNKRVAYMTMYTFLAANGFILDVPEPEAVLVMLEVAAGDRSEERLADWLREQFAARALTLKQRVMRVQEQPSEPYGVRRSTKTAKRKVPAKKR